MTPNVKTFSWLTTINCRNQNGLLAPAVIIPAALPGSATPIHKSGDGVSSVETVSSASSSNRAPCNLGSPASPKVAEKDPSSCWPDEVAFPHTYSSNSIRVKPVGGISVFLVNV